MPTVHSKLKYTVFFQQLSSIDTCFESFSYLTKANAFNKKSLKC